MFFYLCSKLGRLEPCRSARKLFLRPHRHALRRRCAPLRPALQRRCSPWCARGKHGQSCSRSMCCLASVARRATRMMSPMKDPTACCKWSIRSQPKDRVLLDSRRCPSTRSHAVVQARCGHGMPGQAFGHRTIVPAQTRDSWEMAHSALISMSV